jgi:hypothetical protein
MIKLKEIKASTNPDKKLMAIFEITENGKTKTKTTHFGARGYNDYTIYYKTEGKEKADQMKDAYIARHKVNEDFSKVMTAGSLSRWILWNKTTIESSIADYKKKFKL